jgi:hypothetical protein
MSREPSQIPAPILTARSDRALAFVGGGIVASAFWVWLLAPAPASAPSAQQVPTVAPVLPMSLSDLSTQPLAATGLIQRRPDPVSAQYTRPRPAAPDAIATTPQPGASAPVASPAPARPLLPVADQPLPVPSIAPAPLPTPTDMPPPMPGAGNPPKHQEQRR